MAIATSTAIIAGVSAAASVGGNIMQAGAQKKIGKAQADAAGRIREETLQFAAPTSEELENLTKQVNLYDRMYAQSTAMVDQLTEQVSKMYGPAIMEQGKQLYGQLRGEASGVVKSFDNQRSRQREQLRAQLVERLGPDALTSSAGVNALNGFDQQTSDMRAGIEETSLNNAITRIGGLQESQAKAGYTAFQAYTGMSNLLGNIQKGLGDIQSRQVTASYGTGEAIVRTAGSEYLGEMGYGKMISDLGSQGMRFAGMMAAGPAAPEVAAADQATELAGGFRSTPGGRAGISMGPSSYQTPWEAPQMSTMPEPTFGDFSFNR